MNEIKRMQQIAGLINEAEEYGGFTPEKKIQYEKKQISARGLITFEQVKKACIEEYIEYNGGEIGDGITLNEATDIDELAGILDELGFNENEAYTFIFSAILK